MKEKGISKIKKLILLIAVRQIWKLTENIYHLFNQPFLTIKRLLKNKDKSQIFLITLCAVSPIIIYFSARFFWDYYRFKHLLPAVGGFFKLVVIIEIIIFSYILFWTIKAIKKE